MKTQGDPWQLVGLEASEGKRNFAYFMEQGTGKTWTALADAERAFLAGKIDAVVVFAPKGVHSNWTRREIPKHLGVPSVSYAWGLPNIKTKRGKTAYDALYKPTGERRVLRVLSLNFEAMLQEPVREMVADFCEQFRVLAIVDESKKIGNPDSKRTKYIVKAGRAAEARRILSGKPLTKAPMDLFSQFDFLKEGLLGTKSYRAFVAEYAVLLDLTHPKYSGLLRKMGPKGIHAQIVETETDLLTGKPVKKYKNLEKLHAMLSPHVYRCTKDVLGLPPKVYEPVTFELGEEARKVYDQLKEDLNYVSEKEGELSFQAIAARTKMKQVTSGYVSVFGTPEYLPENPRMEAFKDVVDDLPENEKCLVWAIYREEIDQIVTYLRGEGYRVVEYHGGVKDDDRERAIDDFQDGKYDFFVCNKAAYAGITLTAATTAIYYSCDFDNDVRAQSEDRNHRRGTTGSVLYIDLVAEDTIDEDIILDREMKNDVADIVIDGKQLA